MYTRPEITEIYNRIKADLEHRVTGGIKIPRVSMLGIITLVFTGASHLSYGFLEWIYRQIFPDTADSDSGLARYEKIYNLPKKYATQATGIVGFSGDDETVIPAGTVLVDNASGNQYTTDDSYIIGTTETVSVIAVTPGKSGNIESSNLLLMSPIDGVDECFIVSGFQNGQDEESVFDRQKKILDRMARPPASGTESDYERWAREVPGVGNAWCFGAERWMGGGTVGVCVGTVSGDPLESSILTAVSDYLDLVRPVPAKITVFNPVPVLCVYHLNISPNNAEARTAVETQLRQLHLENTAPGAEIKLSKIYGRLSQAGIEDYQLTNIEVNGSYIGVNNIETTRPYLPQYGGCVFGNIT